MCGRYTFAPDMSQLGELLPGFEAPGDLEPRYNIAPTQEVPVVRNDGHRRIELVRWGLVPSWAKDPAIGNRLINARAESLAEKPSFRSAFRRRRCLVLADGFYEWQPVPGQRYKQPMYIRMRDGRPFGFAGLWERWRGPDRKAGGGEPLVTCAIVTTAANELLRPIHDRMPVVLPPAAYPVWLAEDEEPAERLEALLRPHDPSAMEAYPVSRLVNDPGWESPDCIAPLADEA